MKIGVCSTHDRWGIVAAAGYDYVEGNFSKIAMATDEDFEEMKKALAASAMERMNITSLEKRCYRELSGGQQQRVLLARALCATRKLLLLDEPVSGLDPKVTVDMYELISELNRKDGITVIMISHDISAAMKYATHILHIGKKVFFGTKTQYASSDVGRMFDAAEGGDIHA